MPTFGAFRDEITNRTIGSSFRSGWQADYLGLYNFLGPVFGTGGGSNDGEYSNPAFDALLQKGLAEPDQKAADADFAKAGFQSFTRGRFTQIAAHEASHVQFLSSALGDAATKPCTYNL